MRIALGVGAGVLIAIATIWLRRAGALTGWPAVALALLLAVGVPSSRELSRRLFVNGSLVVGWCVVTWWFIVPPTSIGRVAPALALTAGGLTTWVLVRDSRARLRRLVPRVRLVDLVGGAGVAWSIWRLRSRLAVTDAHNALSVAMGGYDNIGHFEMVNMLRLYGATTDRLPPPGPGNSWAYVFYPQSFHSVAASIIELIHSPAYGGPSAELVRQTQATGAVAALATALAVLGLCGLPRLRRSPAVALPAVTLIVASLLIGPGATMLEDGYHNFFFGCVAVGLVVIAAVQVSKVTSPLHLAVLGGLLVAVAHAWLPLLTMAAAGAAVILVPANGRRWSASRRQWLLVGLVVIATLLGVLQALRILSTLLASPSGVLAIGNAFDTPPRETVVLVVLAAIAACLLGPRRRGTSRLIAVALVPAAGAVTLGWIARNQISTTGELGYYFSKYVFAVYIVALLVIAVVVAQSFAIVSVPRATRQTRLRLAAGSVALAAAVAQAFGPFGAAALPSSVDTYSSLPVIDHLLAAGELGAGERSGPVYYLSLSDDAFGDPVRAGFWAMTLAGRATASTAPLTAAVAAGAADGDAGLIAQVPELLSSDPELKVVVSPEQLDTVRSSVPESLADRVVTW